jgi:hypothetical protein
MKLNFIKKKYVGVGYEKRPLTSNILRVFPVYHSQATTS